MKKQLLTAAVLAAIGIHHANATAGALDNGDLTISGFGTLGVAKSDTDEARFVRYNQAEGVGDGARLGLDTNLGLQVGYKINDWLSATGQVLTRKGPRPGFTTDLTWAFVKARVNDDVSVRVGRLALPTFLISEYQNVGYANTMMRPPIEMYGQVPIESHDGIDLIYQHGFGDVTLTAQPFLGVSRGKLYAGGGAYTYRAPTHGLTLSAESGPFTVRVSRLYAELHEDIPALAPLVSALNAYGFANLASDLTLHGQKFAFTAVGGTMDWKNIVLQTEYAQRRAKDPVQVPGTNSWYAMAGYRLGKVMPYYAHADFRSIATTARVPANFPATGALGAPVASLLAPSAQSSDQIGVRWDFTKGMALKLQVDRVKPKTGGGALIGEPAGYNKRVTVVGASVDFVF
ncbi:porin [Duganella sp. CF517]|uniref:porin n=1 Tax=Duganella sp. CF517 TaxID=1881038 RepID=UPI0008CCB6DE|nr:hypothetical protein [Duganella sp. CF517]SEO08994.1 porin [Duganella sp. CF517]